jgi:3-oxoacyl-[acyl-carrier-protein] synthase II
MAAWLCSFIVRSFVVTRRVVVTGLGAITPVGTSVPSFWDSIISGTVGIAPITCFDASGYNVTLAAEVKGFNPLDYMEKSQARTSDRFSQFALAAAAQAIDESGIMGEADAARAGVYFGVGIGGLHTMAEEVMKLNEKGPRRVSPHFITMIIPNIAAGMIAIKYGLHGPCFDITTACASSANAIGEAYRAILHGYVDVMVTGGAEAAIEPVGIAGFVNCMALTSATDPLRASIPFDAERSGFVMGEGGAALVLEEYEHACARGAHIYAEVCGYGTTCDAYHVTAPDPEAIFSAEAISIALDESGVDASKANIYFNAHGTSTGLNDKTETAALKRAFGDHAHRIVMSSTKSMTGHMLGAAGAIEAIASIRALECGIVPPTMGYRVFDPECDLDCCPNEARRMNIDLALSNSIGFGGHNACLAFKPIS